MLKTIHHHDFIFTFFKARGNLKLWQSHHCFFSSSGEFIEILPKETSCPLKTRACSCPNQYTDSISGLPLRQGLDYPNVKKQLHETEGRYEMHNSY